MRSSFSVILCIVLLAAGCSGVAPLEYESTSNGVMSLTVQKPIEARQTLERLGVPEGFAVSVFAAEPDIRNPIALSWDEQGRLWVLESTNYPHEHVGTEAGTDRITICEDTDGDGVADKFVRFAENQPLSTALMVVKGGALVGQAPHIVYMEDTDGDDQFDKKTNVLTDAFGTFDTHAVMNNLKYGIDNYIWGAVGYSGLYEQGHAPDEAYELTRMGLFRFSRDGEYLEAMARFNNNTWGLGIGEDNQIYGSTANNNHAVVLGIPLRFGAEMNVANVQSHFIIEHGSEKPLQQVDFRDGYTAAAGAFAYAGRAYPQKYWGALMVTEPTGHVLHSVYLEEDGALFKEKEGIVENLLQSSDDWVAPVFADIGPDEQVWVADWYNPVIQHNPDRRGMVNQIWSDRRGEGNAHLNPLRDTEHGRVYRIVYTGAPAAPMPALSRQDASGLVDALGHTNQFWRLAAQRLLIEEQHTGVGQELAVLVQNQDVDETGLNAAAIHALWTLDGLGLIEDHLEVVVEALAHPSPGVRKAALQVLPAGEAGSRALLAAGVLEDDNLNTRLAAVLEVVDWGTVATPALVEAAENTHTNDDPWLQAAVDLFAEPETEETAVTASADKKRGSGMPVAYLTVNAVPNMMAFQQTSLTAYEGQPIQMTFNNIHPDLHNVVLLEKDTDIQAFGEALNAYAVSPDAMENQYIPEAYREAVLASTGVLSYQESAVLDTEGLTPGTYVYICTVPGHWMVMQGVLTIEPLS